MNLICVEDGIDSSKDSENILFVSGRVEGEENRPYKRGRE